MRKLFMIFIIIVCGTSASFAEIYSWTDEKGVKHFSSTPPEEGDNVKQSDEVQYDAKQDEERMKEYEQWLNQKNQEQEAESQEKQRRADQEKQDAEKAAAEAEKARFEAEKARLEAEKAQMEVIKKGSIYRRQ